MPATLVRSAWAALTACASALAAAQAGIRPYSGGVPSPVIALAASPVPLRSAGEPAVGTFNIVKTTGAPSASGEIVIAPKKGDCYQLRFTHKDGPEWTGAAVQIIAKDGERSLWTAFGTPQTVGLGVFDINGGSLDGKWYNGWSDDDPRNTGIETLRGPATLDGEFTIIAARTPHDAVEYTGTCNIKPLELDFAHGCKSYALTWTIAGSTYAGIGLRSRDNKLYVALGTGEAFSIGSFRLGPNGDLAGECLSNRHAKSSYTAAKRRD